MLDRVGVVQQITSPLLTTPETMWRCRKISATSCLVRARQLAGGAGEWSKSGGVGEWRDQKACWAHLRQAVHLSSHTRMSRATRCASDMSAPVSYLSSILTAIRPSTCLTVLSHFSLPITRWPAR